MKRTEQYNKIITGARQCFYKLGYYGASITVLARECAVSKGAFYHYFDGKKDMAIGVVKETITELRLLSASSKFNDTKPHTLADAIAEGESYIKKLKTFYESRPERIVVQKLVSDIRNEKLLSFYDDYCTIIKDNFCKIVGYIFERWLIETGEETRTGISTHMIAFFSDSYFTILEHALFKHMIYGSIRALDDAARIIIGSINNLTDNLDKNDMENLGAVNNGKL